MTQEAGIERSLEAELEDARQELTRARSALQELSKVGMALMSEREPAQLFDLILTQARALTVSDGGTLYLVEEEDGERFLRFLHSQIDTLPDLTSPNFKLPLNENSIAGYAATTGQPLVLEDVYEIPGDMPFSHNKAAFDEKYGYRAKSMLVVPMIDHKDRVVGVLQLINRKSDRTAEIRTDEDSDRWVLPYTEREVAIVSSLAGQAAVSIENGMLYQDIENLFAGFIKAAVTAIDRRDPTTSGHSVRVTELTCDVAEIVSQQTEGPFADKHFSEEEMKQLRYAGLLHDFGKVAVKEETLIKKNKLSPVMGARVESRFKLIRKTLETDAANGRTEAVSEKGKEGAAEDLAAIDAKLAEDLATLAEYWEAVKEANVPRILDEEAAEVLQEIAQQSFVDPDGKEQAYITPHELHFLQIKRGSLDENERKQIQAHVVHSYDFLLNIPWTEELSRIAEIVRGHHEKLDGSGYPDGVTGDQLSLETRIMTVCDIFDALTASDRPYKKAMPLEKALQVLQWEAKDGMLDTDLVDLFVQSGVYKKVLERDWREF
ncbi:MAG: GAF domain-containing protein [Gemmatimonadota bacterium]|nr:GAF domain-containing protein [Gemmatimonadota bacterium]MDH3422495.1 GAF domain-containing protein [Gemmatimonadota bacterium]